MRLPTIQKPKKSIRIVLYLVFSILAGCIFLFARTFTISPHGKPPMSLYRVFGILHDPLGYLNGVIFGAIVFIALVFLFEGNKK